jgi:hypothetical protein
MKIHANEINYKISQSCANEKVEAKIYTREVKTLEKHKIQMVYNNL